MGCRSADGGLELARRTKKQFGEHAKGGPCRGPSIPVGRVADIAPITGGDLGLDTDVPAIYDKAFPGEDTFRICQEAWGASTRRRRKEDIAR